MTTKQYQDLINAINAARFERPSSFEARKEAYRKQYYGQQWKLNPEFAKPAPLKVNYSLIEEIKFIEV